MEIEICRAIVHVFLIGRQAALTFPRSVLPQLDLEFPFADVSIMSIEGGFHESFQQRLRQA